MKKRLAILGSTGSIGINALKVVSMLKNRFDVVALTCDTNIKLLSRQISVFKPRIACAGTKELAHKLKPASGKIKSVFGLEGLEEIVTSKDVDTVLFALSGISCLVPLVKAIEHKKSIALANKESIVSAGPIIMSLARRNGVRIVPVDSEHNAIFQCLDGRNSPLSKIYLTGSGGPLLNIERKRFDRLPKSFMLNHPKWKMGKKISVDSATMMNKGLEIIEAQNLFGIDEKNIEVLVHPEAVVHSMVEFSDGAVLAGLAVADMRIPIQYALTYPERLQSQAGSLSFEKIGSLCFKKPDTKKFPCLRIARHAAVSGGTAPAVLCAADEEAVRQYLDGNIAFTDIPKVIERVLSRHRNDLRKVYSISDVLNNQCWAREEAKSVCCQ